MFDLRNDRLSPDARQRHPHNDAGPFYVENGCCASCAFTEETCGRMLGWHVTSGQSRRDVHHCYIARQPENFCELLKLFHAMWMQDLDCLRYGGSDPLVIQWMADLRLADYCDTIPPKV